MWGPWVFLEVDVHCLRKDYWDISTCFIFHNSALKISTKSSVKSWNGLSVKIIRRIGEITLKWSLIWRSSCMRMQSRSCCLCLQKVITCLTWDRFLNWFKASRWSKGNTSLPSLRMTAKSKLDCFKDYGSMKAWESFPIGWLTKRTNKFSLAFWERL